MNNIVANTMENITTARTLLLAILISLLFSGAHFANCQTTEGDLDIWRAAGDVYLSCGIALLNGQIPIASFSSAFCWLDGYSWQRADFTWDFPTDMAEGPDGKVWMTSFSTEPTGVAYLEDIDQIHHTDCRWWSYPTHSLDIEHWQGVSYMVFCTDIGSWPGIGRDAHDTSLRGDEVNLLGQHPHNSYIAFTGITY